MHSKKYRIVQLFVFLISIFIFFVHAQAKEVILDCVDVKEIQCIALELKQINKCSLLFSADARSKFDLKDVPSEEIITIFVSEMAVSSMTSSVFFTGSRVEMDVPKARILHTQICKNIPMRAYYFDQKTHSIHVILILAARWLTATFVLPCPTEFFPLELNGPASVTERA